MALTVRHKSFIIYNCIVFFLLRLSRLIVEFFDTNMYTFSIADSQVLSFDCWDHIWQKEIW